VVSPVSSGAAAPQRIFEVAVHQLHYAVVLWMVGHGGDALGAELGAEVLPELGGKLGAPVGGDGVGCAEAGHPAIGQGMATVGGGGRGQGDSLKPPQKTGR